MNSVVVGVGTVLPTKAETAHRTRGGGEDERMRGDETSTDDTNNYVSKASKEFASNRSFVGFHLIIAIIAYSTR